jgi:hypothetical protein
MGESSNHLIISNSLTSPPRPPLLPLPRTSNHLYRPCVLAMESEPTDRDIDLEAQQVAAQPSGVSLLLSLLSLELEVLMVREEEVGESEAEEIAIPQSSNNDANSESPLTVTTPGSVYAEIDTEQLSIIPEVTALPSRPPTPSDVSLDAAPEEKRMIGDFDSGAEDLWSLYGKKAKRDDKSRIQTLKEEMNGVFLFVRSYLLHPHSRLGHTNRP